MNFGVKGQKITINVPNEAALFQRVQESLARKEGFALATLNLDHLAKMPRDPAFLAAYQAQDLIVADGRPIVWLSQMAENPVALMPGSDLIVPLCRIAAKLGVSIALVGSTDAALQGAATALEATVPGLKIVLRYAPPQGFDPAGPDAQDVFERLRTSGAGLCFLALGAPKQERLAATGRSALPQMGFASIGAGLDFLAGRQRRAPRLMRALAMEWVWRLLQDPRRLGPRYARCFAILPGHIRAALRQRG